MVTLVASVTDFTEIGLVVVVDAEEVVISDVNCPVVLVESTVVKTTVSVVGAWLTIDSVVLKIEVVGTDVNGVVSIEVLSKVDKLWGASVTSEEF